MKDFVLALLIIAANAAVYKGSSPHESFYKMSPPEGNDWQSRNVAGAILGFAVFGCAYLATVISIVLDIRKTDANYDQLIAEDISTIKNLGLSGRMSEFEAELAIRLSGVKQEDTGDDQLMGEALKLTHDQYKKYM